MPQQKKIKTTIGGQAVMEGIMMQGPQKTCLAVRVPSGDIVTEVNDAAKRPWRKIPLVRGVVSFFFSLVAGYKVLMRSAELSMPEDMQGESESKFDRWVDEKFGDKGTNFIMIIASILGVFLALGLFVFLPTAVIGFLSRYIQLGFTKSILEGAIKIALFLSYLALVRRMNDIKRVFSYHGAEHKTIFCYEAGEPLTVDNIRGKSRFHPRCGTSFLVIVLVVSILLFSVISWDNLFFRVSLKLLLMPLVMGVSFEFIMLAGRYDNAFTRILSAPGMWVQRLTTAEPDDSMIEVAIAALTPVLPENPEEAKW